jgi:hypothetical protein
LLPHHEIFQGADYRIAVGLVACTEMKRGLVGGRHVCAMELFEHISEKRKQITETRHVPETFLGAGQLKLGPDGA